MQIWQRIDAGRGNCITRNERVCVTPFFPSRGYRPSQKRRARDDGIRNRCRCRRKYVGRPVANSTRDRNASLFLVNVNRYGALCKMKSREFHWASPNVTERNPEISQMVKFLSRGDLKIRSCRANYPSIQGTSDHFFSERRKCNLQA